MASRLGPDSTLGGKYRLVRKLAGGGMGAVWLAKHQVLDAEVAVKLMSPALADTPTARARFEREAKASAQLKSLHICKVQDYGVEDDTPFMVMERLEGVDLGDRLAQVGRLSPAELAPIVTQICKALSVAHAAGIVHRDLKPSNVFLVREGRDEIVKLLDFGIARELNTQLVDEKTSSGIVIGSPHHMSPEQARGERVDPRSDLWSLGVVMFKALTGKRPFEGDQVTAVMLAIVSQPIPRVSEVCEGLPAALDAFFDRALSREVDARFQSADELCDAFAAIAGGASGAPWLARRAGSAGPDEPTREGARAATPLGGTPVSDSTASRELRAVTTQTGAGPVKRSAARRRLPWVVALALLGALGLLVASKRDGAPSAATSPSASSPAPPDSATTPPGATVALQTSEPSAPTVSPVPRPSGSAAPAASPALATGRAGPRPSASGRPSATSRGVDPFTGL